MKRIEKEAWSMQFNALLTPEHLSKNLDNLTSGLANMLKMRQFLVGQLSAEMYRLGLCEFGHFLVCASWAENEKLRSC